MKYLSHKIRFSPYITKKNHLRVSKKGKRCLLSPLLLLLSPSMVLYLSPSSVIFFLKKAVVETLVFSADASTPFRDSPQNAIVGLVLIILVSLLTFWYELWPYRDQ